MTQAIEIRTCREADLPAVQKLLAQLTEVSHSQTDFHLDTFRAIFTEMEKSPDVYFNLVGIYEGAVAAFVSVVFYKTLFHRGGTALINELVVDRQLRGSGIGKALIDSVVAESRRRGMDEVEVGTERDNLLARQFYQKCGFDEEYVLLGMEF